MKTIKLLPFNLEEAIAGKPLMARNGTPVRYIGYSTYIKNQSLQLAVEMDGTLQGRYLDGRHYCDSELDIFMAPVTRKMYIGIVKSKNPVISTTLAYENKEELIRKNSNMADRLEIVEVEVNIVY